MDPGTWNRVCDLFDSIVALPAGERAAALASASSEEAPEVAAEVARMLAADREHVPLDEPLARLPDLAALPEDEPRPGSTVGGFELLEVLGEGGMATVYRARQSDPRRIVALKVRRGDPFSASGLRRFEYETEVLARLRHPCIAQLYEAGTHWRKVGGRWVRQPYCVLEFVEGARDLVSWARERGLSLGERLDLFADVCGAVSHAHRAGVLHRDLKPGNLLVGGDGRVRVIDFGIALPVDPAAADERLTREGQVVGTLAAMSPEQLAGGAAHVDARSDVYSLGAVLYELVEEMPPRDLAGLPLEGALAALRERSPRPPRRAPRELRWILARALAADPERRYGSVDELAEDVRRFRADEPLRAGPPSRIYALRKFVRRHRVAATAVAAVAVALAAGFVRAEHLRRRAEASEQSAVREAARAVDAAAALRQETGRYRAVHDFLLEMIENAGGREASVVALLDSARARLATMFADEPRLRASVEGTLAKAYLGLDLPGPGGELLASAVAAEREHGTPGDRLWLQLQMDWVRHLLGAERYGEALALCDELLAWTAFPERAGRATHASLLARRGVMLDRTGRPTEARAAYEAALAVYDAEGLERDSTYWATLAALAGVQSAAGEVEASLATLERVLAGREALGGPSDDMVAATLAQLGSTYTRLGRHAEALPYQEEGLALVLEARGPEHWLRFEAMNGLACTLMNVGRTDEARALFRECIEKGSRYEGSALAVAGAREAAFLALVNLGFLDRHEGDRRSAVANFERALADFPEMEGSPHAEVVRGALAAER